MEDNSKVVLGEKSDEDVVKPLSDNDIREEFNNVYARMRKQDEMIGKILTLLVNHTHGDGKKPVVETTLALQFAQSQQGATGGRQSLKQVVRRG